MVSSVLITPLSNVDGNTIIDYDLLEEKEFDSSEDLLDIFNVKFNEQRKGYLINISIYEDCLIFDGVNYKILRMFSY